MKKQQGLTLIELMIVVAIVAILAAIAYPSYTDYVRKARRADGMDALLRAQALQEKWRANNTSYTGVVANVGGSDSAEEHYVIAVTAGTATATGYTMTATAQGDQANDDEGGQSCEVLTITVNAGNPRGSKTPVECW